MNRSLRIEHVGLALAWIGLAGLAYLTFLIVAPFLSPLAWAAVIAIVFHPVHARLASRLGPTWAAAATTVAVTAIVIVPLLTLTVAFVREAVQAVADLQRGVGSGNFAWVQRAWNAVVERVPGNHAVDIGALATDAARRGAILLASQAGAVARNTAGFLFDLVLALFATFFLLRDSEKIVDVIRRVLPIEEPARDRLLLHTRELIRISVISSGVVAAVQGALGGIVFAAVGIDAPVFWGVVLAFFCLLPFGAWVVWLPAAGLLAASGEIGRGLTVAGLGAGIVSTVDNVLRPMLLSGGSRMNGLLIFISLLGGVVVFGVLGLVLGPLVIATGEALLRTYVDVLPAPSRRMSLDASQDQVRSRTP